MQEGEGGLGDSRWYKPWSKEEATNEPRCPINVQEAEALIEYAARKGIYKDDIPAKLNEAIEAFKKDPQKEYESNVVRLYAQLCELTGKVSGKNLMDSHNFSYTTSGLRNVTVGFTLLALFLAGLDLVMLDTARPDPFVWLHYWTFHTYFGEIIGPFVWGGLGACIFVIKLVSDHKSSLTFDNDQFPGWKSRILLGAVLGGGFAYLFDTDQFIEGDFGRNAIAFVSGIMVKIIYGALEKFAETIADKFDLGDVRARNNRKDEIQAFLARELSNTDIETDSEVYEAIVELLKRRGKSNG